MFSKRLHINEIWC